MTKVSIIDIDLGEIDKIISKGVSELHGEAAEKLEVAIKERKKVEEVRIKRQQEKTQTANAITKVMDSAYDKLVDAGDKGIPANDILELVQPVIANASAFTLRMKTILREKGNPYVIKRKKIQKVSCYIFEPFNAKENEDTA